MNENWLRFMIALGAALFGYHAAGLTDGENGWSKPVPAINACTFEDVRLEREAAMALRSDIEKLKKEVTLLLKIQGKGEGREE